MKKEIAKLSLKYKKGKIENFSVRSSLDSYKAFMKFFESDTLEYSEEVVCIYLNRANESIGYQKLSSGGMVSCVIDIKMIASTSLLSGASGVVMAHNHPSGNLKPSESDRVITKKIKEGLKLIDVVLIDHLIISKEGYYSFADESQL